MSEKKLKIAVYAISKTEEKHVAEDLHRQINHVPLLSGREVAPISSR